MSELAAPPPDVQPQPQNASPQPPAGRRAAFAFIFVTVALDMLALGVVIPVLPQLILGMEGGDTASAALWVGRFGTLWAAMQFVSMPILGALSDRVGRRPIILLSNFGLATDYVVMALAPTMGWLFVGRLVSGVTSASITTAFAYVADVTSPEKRAAAFGTLGAAFGLGFVIGPALGGYLGGFDPRLPFWVACTLSGLNGVYGLFVLPESLPKEKRAEFNWKRANPLGAFALLRSNPQLFSLSTVKFVNDLAHVVYPSTFALYAMHRFNWGPQQVGFMLGGVGLAGIVVQAGLVRRVVAAVGESKALLIGLACGAIGFAIYGLAPNVYVLLCGIPVAALWGLAGPSAQSLLSKRVAPNEQGRLQGALSGLTGLAGLIGPTIFTSVFAYFISAGAPVNLPGAAFVTASLLVVISLPMAVRALATQLPAAPTLKAS